MIAAVIELFESAVRKRRFENIVAQSLESSVADELVDLAVQIPRYLIELWLSGCRQCVEAQRVALRFTHVDAVGHGGMIM